MNEDVKVYVTLFEILPWNLPGGTEVNQEKPKGVVTHIQTRHI